jgi:hypothetical protein
MNAIALLEILIPALLKAGLEIAPLVQGLIASQSAIKAGGADRPDIGDAAFAALEQIIKDLQAKIDAA